MDQSFGQNSPAAGLKNQLRGQGRKNSPSGRVSSVRPETFCSSASTASRSGALKKVNQLRGQGRKNSPSGRVSSVRPETFCSSASTASRSGALDSSEKETAAAKDTSSY